MCWPGLYTLVVMDSSCFRGHLQTMICTLNIIVTLRGVLAVTLIISFLCNRMGMRQKNKWSSNMFAILCKLKQTTVLCSGFWNIVAYL